MVCPIHAIQLMLTFFQLLIYKIEELGNELPLFIKKINLEEHPAKPCKFAPTYLTFSLLQFHVKYQKT